MTRPIATLVTLLALSGGARAACVIERAQVNVPDYSALQTVTGSLDVFIRCDTPLDQATLTLAAPGMRPESGDRWQLTLVQATDSLRVTLRSTAGPLLGGLNIVGSQSLHFPLTVESQQWIRTGLYALPLTLSLSQPLP